MVIRMVMVIMFGIRISKTENNVNNRCKSNKNNDYSDKNNGNRNTSDNDRNNKIMIIEIIK